MTDDDVKNLLTTRLHFSKYSLSKIDQYINLLIKFNQNYNLISKSTEKQIWSRHVLDSAQLLDFIDKNDDLDIADLGSGAGLPGVILALSDQKNKFHVKLYEKSPVKRQFLSSIKRKLGINIEILSNVYDYQIKADYVVCRAFKKLSEMIKISRENIQKPHKLLILKGKNAQNEINELSLGSKYSYKIKNSITDKDSKILIVQAF